MSKSDTKAESRLTPPIRNRVIPRFHQRPDQATGSFVTDLDTERPPPRFRITHRASHSEQQGPSRRRNHEAGGRAPAMRDYSAMSTTARPWISRLRSAV